MTTDPAPAASTSQSQNGEHITEDEASLYDRQIRLWGLEAQNRMRSSTVLVISLKGVAHEIIKNLVLAGIGKLIVMDNEVVTEEDLGSGFLFREEDGAVGQDRATAAAAQITSLNPLVTLQTMTTTDPIVPSASSSSSPSNGSSSKAVDWLRQEGVNVVVACDLPQSQMESIDAAAREAEVMFYAAGTYGFYGYAFADLGEQHDFVYTPASVVEAAVATTPLSKGKLSYPTRIRALDSTNWSTLDHTQTSKGGSPLRGLGRHVTRELVPQTALGVLAMWEYEKKLGKMPEGQDEQVKELTTLAEDLRVKLGVNQKFAKQVDPAMIEHLSSHAAHFFPPTLAVLGGLVAQDVLRALSKRGVPFANLLTLDSMAGTAVVLKWNMADIASA